MVLDLTLSDILDILRNIGDWIFVIGLVIAPIMVVIGAAFFLLGGNDPNRLGTAKKIFLWTAVGFTLTLFAKGVFTVLRSILGV